MTARDLEQMGRIVVKIGSSLLIDSLSGRLRRHWLDALADDLAALHRANKDLLVVSSGAIGLGRRRLGLKPGELHCLGSNEHGDGRAKPA